MGGVLEQIQLISFVAGQQSVAQEYPGAEPEVVGNPRAAAGPLRLEAAGHWREPTYRWGSIRRIPAVWG